ncbi:phage portal protein [Lactococcus petauri]|uniref:phage portal protein n=1 Tax=Lactococcus petauri TaxID=1940789 RepID=UPI00254F06A0|nr:phage portal protein [Lactococcus petauri]
MTSFKMIDEPSSGFVGFGQNVYEADIVRSAVRPLATAIGKTIPKHRFGDKINPTLPVSMVLNEPNAIMSMQMLLEKTIWQYRVNGNAFIYVEKGDDGKPIALYPIVSQSLELLINPTGEYFIKFILRDGKEYTFKYRDLIHIRNDFTSNEVLGDSLAPSLLPLLEVVQTTDQGIISAIKNSNVVKWLLKFNQTLRPEDIKSNTKQFVDDFLRTDSEGIGAAGVDSKADAIQVQPYSYVPEKEQSAATRQRILDLFNTNNHIVQSDFSENQWIAYYETQIEPVLLQLSDTFTKAFFSRRERALGNSIMFESNNLQFASMQTKLQMVGWLDRGVMTINEYRMIALGLEPVEGGDARLLRKDTDRLGQEKNNGGEIEKDST